MNAVIMNTPVYMQALDNLLQVYGLRKTFGERLLFDVPELSLKHGQSYVLTGSNGSGKTTLLRILAGLEPAQINSLYFAGRVVPAPKICTQLAPRVIYLHQHPYLFSTSVAANIAYGLKASGLNLRQRDAKVNAAMQWAGVQYLAQIPPHKLSGGEKQRVALARAKVLNPEILLLDEPTANLDEEARQQVIALIRKMCDDNHCVVIATHDPELMALKDAVKLRLENASLQTQ
ncbi:MAG: ABC transporter ATP-binding protein [Methylophilaceae bacterium]